MNTKGAPTNLARADLPAIALETRDDVPTTSGGAARHDRCGSTVTRTPHRSLRAAVGGTIRAVLVATLPLLTVLASHSRVMAQNVGYWACPSSGSYFNTQSWNLNCCLMPTCPGNAPSNFMPPLAGC